MLMSFLLGGNTVSLVIDSDTLNLIDIANLYNEWYISNCRSTLPGERV